MTAGSRTATPTEPFCWPGGDVGCLLVHGFTGTPYEMRFLGERLNARGYGVLGVRLAGHATEVSDLAARRWTDWYAAVEEGLRALAARSQTVVAVGQSLGSLLVLRLARFHPELVGAAAVLSTALVLANPWPARLAALARFLPGTRLYVRKHGSDIADPDARRIHPGYDRMPLHSIFELTALQREVRMMLGGVTQPVLAIHALHDHTTPFENLALLRSALPNLRDTVVLEKSFHVASVDVEKERVATAVGDFVAAVAVERQREAATAEEPV